VEREFPHAEYVASVAREWALRRDLVPQAPATLFLGGGTPSRTPPGLLERLVRLVSPSGEVTLEANPEDVTAEAARAWRDLGVTRLSLGVQSFSAALRRRLGRARPDPTAAVDLALAAGFASVSLDLIFGLGSLAELDGDLSRALASGVPHLSAYGLTVEPGTLFARRGVRTDDDAWRDQYEHLVARLDAAGLERYEVSNFARPAHRSTHNEHYWRARHWVGLGVAAHGWWPDGRRTRNVATTADYLRAADPLAEALRPAPRALAFELAWSTLRHRDGVDRALVRRWTGVELTVHPSLSGFLEHDARTIRLRGPGWALADALADRIVPSEIP
jgi:oxygen-independent coproporphyrinogen-3 oxidase